jgi:hypothetical protein
MDMVADAAAARAAIRFDTAQMIAALDKRIALMEKGR